MKKSILIPSIAICLLITAACSSLYRGVVTFTSVVDSASAEYAAVFNKGLISPELDLKITKAHDGYRQACKATADALRTYKLTGDNAPYLASLSAAKTFATQFIDLIVPLLTASKGDELKTSLSKATVL